MKKLIFFLLIFVSKLVYSQEITFDRPGITDLFNTVKKSKFQLEIGYDYLNQVKNQAVFPTFTARYGLNDNSEFRFVFDHGFYSHSMINNFENNNLTVMSLGFKKHIYKSLKTNFSVLSSLKSSHNLLNKNFYRGFDIIGIIQKNINNFDFINNFGYIYENYNIKNRIYFANCLGYKISNKSSIFIEDYFFLNNLSKIEHGNIFGYTYLLNSKTQLDASIGSLNVLSKHYFASVGFSHCF